ncbi:MAG: sulfur carrier protein ThiS [Candidatus Omnitrophica bacterium]|nr:sulfur carrier protein ThiS [Candidatus Omnitrophota bacterium]
MKVRINGKEENIEVELTLLALLEQRGLSQKKIVVEHNAKIVDREDLSSLAIKEDDVIEIISFVGGG